MRNRMLRVQRVWEIALGLTVALSTNVADSAAVPGELPSYKQVRKAVLAHFGKLPDYRSADIISRGEVVPLISQLQRMGWKVADDAEILDDVPADDDFLIRQLRTSRGRKFMRQLGTLPGRYSRLERLSRLPHGKQSVKDLIRGPDGYKLIEYMTETSGGRALGRQLSNAPKGRHFNDPTGRIYTAERLLERLKKSLAAAGKTAAEK